MRRLAILIWYGGVALLGIGLFLFLIGIFISPVIIMSGLFCCLFGYVLFVTGGKLWNSNELQRNHSLSGKLKNRR